MIRGDLQYCEAEGGRRPVAYRFEVGRVILKLVCHTTTCSYEIANEG